MGYLNMRVARWLCAAIVAAAFVVVAEGAPVADAEESTAKVVSAAAFLKQLHITQQRDIPEIKETLAQTRRISKPKTLQLGHRLSAKAPHLERMRATVQHWTREPAVLNRPQPQAANNDEAGIVELGESMETSHEFSHLSD